MGRGVRIFETFVFAFLFWEGEVVFLVGGVGGVGGERTGRLGDSGTGFHK